MPDGGVTHRRVLHDGHLLGDLGQQPHRTQQHVVEIDGPRQKGLDGPLLSRGQRLEPAYLAVIKSFCILHHKLLSEV